MRRVIAAGACASVRCVLAAAGRRRRPGGSLNVDDLFNLQDVRDPQRSPDGKWVAYTVTRAIKDTDKNDTDVWMVSWDGTQQIQLTSTPDGESRPRWSPDDKYLSFVSSRQGAKDGAGLAAEPRRRRSDQAHRRQGRRLGLRLVARQQAPRARRRATPIRAIADERSDEKAKDGRRRRRSRSSIDRYQFKADVERLPARRALAPLSVRRRHEEGRAADAGRVRRGVAGLVARRHADRVRPPARRRRRRQGAEPRPVRDRRAGRRAAEAAHDDAGGRERGGWRGARTASRSRICSATSRSTPPTTRTGSR